MLKLSESTPATGELLKRLFAQVFPEDLVAVVLGEADVRFAQHYGDQIFREHLREKTFEQFTRGRC
ncbi:hypothetical protein QCD79_34160, partial [Pseudomonas quasicaspiana]|nr:hypothetical protein [Pseudomonas quasicaspiana]